MRPRPKFSWANGPGTWGGRLGGNSKGARRLEKGVTRLVFVGGFGKKDK